MQYKLDNQISEKELELLSEQELQEVAMLLNNIEPGSGSFEGVETAVQNIGQNMPMMIDAAENAVQSGEAQGSFYLQVIEWVEMIGDVVLSAF